MYRICTKQSIYVKMFADLIYMLLFVLSKFTVIYL